MQLIKYDAACRAVAEVKSIDEAKDLRDKAEGMRAYAHQANNRQLEIDAAEIRMRAERRLGELIQAQKETVGLAKGGEHGGRTRIDGSRVDPANPRPTLAEVGIDKHLADRARKMAAISEKKFEKQLGAWRELAEAQGGLVPTSTLYADRIKNDKHAIHYSSETAEHYTPTKILDAVISCLGAIDLDPCSNEGEPNVPAARHYTRADDGLSKAWKGRVFMNPPYGNDIDPWPVKLVDEYRAGNATEAIALVPARTDTQWFRVFRDGLVCLVTGRLRFIGNDASAPFPSALVYLGKHRGRFLKQFSPIGDVWERVN